MYLAKNLKHLRLSHGLSQDYLAKKFGYKSFTTIQKWETGTSEPSLEVIYELSKLYGVTMHALYTLDLEQGQKDKSGCKKIPLVGTIAAGLPILAEENIEGYFNIDPSINADFALRIKGDSMLEAGILPRDIVFIKKQDCLENGEVGAVLIKNEATLKRFYRKNGTIILQAENAKYQPIILTNGDVRILGKLVATLHIKEALHNGG